MSNGEVCCILGICCPPEAQEDAIVRALVDADVSEQDARKAAQAMRPYLNTKAILKAIGQKLDS